MDGIHLINLKKRNDRLEKFKLASGLKEDEYNLFEAVDGVTLTWNDEINRLFRNNQFGSSRGVIGCALSHYTLWKQIASTRGELHLILEDDALFVDDWIDKWNHKYYPSLPKDRFDFMLFFFNKMSY